jgi:hypothetical protein
LPPKGTANLQAPDVVSEPENPDRAAEYTQRIADLEGRVKMLKQ